MPAAVVVGAQWGDEGKGKVTDFLAARADMVVRYQGGDNAGHTVVTGGREYKLFLLPSGILRQTTLNILGNGMVIDIAVLLDEIARMRSYGIPVKNLRISHAAHMLLPYHRALDEADEERLGAGSIGTTKRGIGPAYLDKYARIGLRVGDILDPVSFREKLRENVAYKNLILERVYGKPGFDAETMADEYLKHAEGIREFVTDTSLLINEGLKQGKRVLFEGAQGTMLEVDLGTYPYVTSSHPTAGGACIGAGVGPTNIDTVIGVVKAFTSRVGNGPFPTELFDADGEYIRERGQEYGTRTGRPRRVGWLDAVTLRAAARINSFNGVAITRLDTLAGLEKVKICVAYKLAGKTLKEAPINAADLAKAEAVYQEFPGWTPEEIAGVTTYEGLPQKVKDYVAAIESEIGVEARILGVGPDRSQAIMKSEIAF